MLLTRLRRRACPESTLADCAVHGKVHGQKKCAGKVCSAGPSVLCIESTNFHDAQHGHFSRISFSVYSGRGKQAGLDSPTGA
jgi:hypothetical protein